MAKRPSIHDVAAAAGVSITTVSHTLSGKGRLPQKTRDRVQAIAEQIGYVPSFHARGLATGRTMLLAMQASGFESRALVPQVGYFVELLNAASKRAFDLGYGLVLVPPGTSAEGLQRLSVDGAAIIDPTGDEPLLRALREEGKPVVTTGRVLGDAAGTAWVDTDHVAGVRLVLDHFAEMGCDRPALLTSARGPSYVEDVRRGYRDWCREHGRKPMVASVRSQPTELAAERAIGRLLDAEQPPDAVYASLDVLAIGALTAARARGIAVPEGLAIGAITDSGALRAVTPPVTALDLHPDRIGRRAIELLVALVEGRSSDWAGTTVDVELLRRASTDRSSARAGAGVVLAGR